ncbi:MAG: exosortase A [Gammaproteobacteria bacterium]
MFDNAFNAHSWFGSLAAAFRSRVWGPRLALVGVALVGVIAVYASTFGAIVATWWDSETYAHGFVIGPISLYLIWGKREQLARVIPRTAFGALPVIVALNVLWLLGFAADALGVQQFAVVAMIPVVVVLVFGWRVGRTIAFPLGILLLGVPIGDSLIPPLIHSTASIAVHAVSFTGVPVFWEGNRITLPNGDWSVVSACSGIHYMFAMLTLTLLYGYLTYRALWKRVLIVVAGLALAIVGNGLRAYIIIMLGYLSNMHLAVGIDHIVYGWIFFGVLSLLLFWLGGFLRERVPASPEAAASPPASASGPGRPQEAWLKPGIGVALTVIVALSVSAWAARLGVTASEPVVARLSAPAGNDDWKLTSGDTALKWQPVYVGASAELERIYEKGKDWVGLHVAYYATQRQGAELINFHNVLIPERGTWVRLWSDKRRVVAGGRKFRLTETRISSPSGNLLVWRWYWINGSQTASPYMVKFYQAVDDLLYGRRAGAGVTIYTAVGPERADVRHARKVLQDYLTGMMPGVEAVLHETGARVAASTSAPK